jgi:hypothetical protein
MDSNWWKKVADDRDRALRGAKCPVCDREIEWNRLASEAGQHLYAASAPRLYR